MTEDLAILIVSLVVLGVPVVGLTARFALKPIVESIVRLREAFMQDTLPAGAKAEDLARLEQEVSDLRDQVMRLTEAAEFDRKLLASDGE